MGGAIKIGRIAGIAVQIHLTWFVALGVISMTLARGVFPAQMPNLPANLYWSMGITGAVLLFLSVMLHELGHALAARHFRIATRSITLFLFGGVAQITSEPEDPRQEFWIAIAGPITSFFLAGFFWLITPHGQRVPAAILMEYLSLANLILCGFNLLPALPLDGGRILRAVLWRFLGLEQATRIASGLGRIAANLLIVLGVVTVLGGQLIQGIWMILIGWFLDHGAGASYQQLLLRNALRGVRVRDVMTTEVITIEQSLSVEQAVMDHFLRHKHGGYPVSYGDRVVGIVTLHDIKPHPRDTWSDLRVRDVMTPIARAQTVRTGTSAYEALARMLRANVGRLLVMGDHGELEGLLTRSDLMYLIRIRTELGADRPAERRPSDASADDAGHGRDTSADTGPTPGPGA